MTYLLAETHVELLLDPVTATCEFVPDPFCMTFVECLDQVRAACKVASIGATVECGMSRLV